MGSDLGTSMFDIHALHMYLAGHDNTEDVLSYVSVHPLSPGQLQHPGLTGCSCCVNATRTTTTSCSLLGGGGGVSVTTNPG